MRSANHFAYHGLPHEEELRKFLSNCAYCETCRRVRPSIRAHRSLTKKQGKPHSSRTMTAQEEREQAEAWLARGRGGIGVVEQQVSAEIVRQQALPEPIDEGSSAVPYRTEFGAYRNKT